MSKLSEDPQLGMQLAGAHRWAEALPILRRAIKRHPYWAELRHDLGCVCTNLGLYDEAIVHLKKSIDMKRTPESFHDLGCVYNSLCDYGPAMQAFKDSLDVDPNYPRSWGGVGIVRSRLGDYAGSMEAYNLALEIDPHYAEAHRNRAFLRIMLGDSDGWKEHLWRHFCPESKVLDGAMDSMWRGEDLTGEILLLHKEQGIGDTIQFLRYLPLIKRRGNPQIVMVVQAELVSLIKRHNLADEVVPMGSSGIPYTKWAALMDLPAVLPWPPPGDSGLVADPERLAKWRERLPQGTGYGQRLNVGLKWSGNPAHARDKERSIPFGLLAPLLSVPGVTFYSLQTKRDGESGICNGWGSEFDLSSFEDAAAACSALDLIITVDTSLAHLAGAMGCKTWNLLQFSPDYRWMLERADTPWYPTMRLFRQPKLGDWESVISEVASELAKMVQ